MTTALAREMRPTASPLQVQAPRLTIRVRPTREGFPCSARGRTYVQRSEPSASGAMKNHTESELPTAYQEMRSGVLPRTPANSVVGVRYPLPLLLPPDFPRDGGRRRSGPRWRRSATGTRPLHEVDVDNNEQPDWSFWCFVIALVELLLQVMAKR